MKDPYQKYRAQLRIICRMESTMVGVWPSVRRVAGRKRTKESAVGDHRSKGH
jgi:hypothetical protein